MAMSQTNLCTLCGTRNYGQYVLTSFFCAPCLSFRSQQCHALAKTRAKRHQQISSHFSNVYIPYTYKGPTFYNKTQSNWGGDSNVAEIKFSNGDTEEWTKLEIKGLDKPDFNQVFGIIKLAIASTDKNWDNKRGCWFIRASLVETLILGFNSLTDSLNKGHSQWSRISLIDKREKYESFDEFFNAPPPMSGKAPKTKIELVKAMEHLLKTNEIYVTIREDIDLDSAKKYYRKAALAFHPDRNNGDGTKMSELNMIWNELQQRF